MTKDTVNDEEAIVTHQQDSNHYPGIGIPPAISVLLGHWYTGHAEAEQTEITLTLIHNQ